jgi:hypothetical protein
MDWTEILAAEAENRRARLATELLASTACGSTATRVQAFVEQAGGCRVTFFNYRRKLGDGNLRIIGVGSRRLSSGPSRCSLILRDSTKSQVQSRAL